MATQWRTQRFGARLALARPAAVATRWRTQRLGARLALARPAAVAARWRTQKLGARLALTRPAAVAATAAETALVGAPVPPALGVVAAHSRPGPLASC